jgi:hypothetical protein
MTAAFSVTYMFSKFMHLLFSIMISPQFLNSVTASTALSVIAFSCVMFGSDAFAPHRLQKMVEAEQAREEDVGSSESEEESEADEEEDIESSEKAEATEESEADEEGSEEDVSNAEESQASEEASQTDEEKDVRDTAIALINLDPLRNAPPLPESDSEESGSE